MALWRRRNFDSSLVVIMDKKVWTNSGKFKLPHDLEDHSGFMFFSRDVEIKMTSSNYENKTFVVIDGREVSIINEESNSDSLVLGNISYFYNSYEEIDDYDNFHLKISTLFLEYVNNVYSSSDLAFFYRNLSLIKDNKYGFSLRDIHNDIFSFIRNEYILKDNFDYAILRPLLKDISREEKQKTIKSNNIMLPLNIYMGNMYGKSFSYKVYTKMTNGNCTSYSSDSIDEYSLCSTQELTEAEMITDEIKFDIL